MDHWSLLLCLAFRLPKLLDSDLLLLVSIDRLVTLALLVGLKLLGLIDFIQLLLKLLEEGREVLNMTIIVLLDNCSQLVELFSIILVLGLEEFKVCKHVIISHLTHTVLADIDRLEDLHGLIDSILQLEIEGQLESQLGNQFKAVVPVDCSEVLVKQ